jgi:hypothetical protein
MWFSRRRMLDRTPNETFDEYRHEGPDAGGAQLPVDVSHPTLEVCPRDPLHWVTQLEVCDDLGDLVLGAGFVPLDGRPRFTLRGRPNRWRRRCEELSASGMSVTALDGSTFSIARWNAPTPIC